MKDLERGNARLRNVVANQVLDVAILKEAAARNSRARRCQGKLHPLRYWTFISCAPQCDDPSAIGDPLTERVRHGRTDRHGATAGSSRSAWRRPSSGR